MTDRIYKPILFDNISEEMKALPNWVVWKYDKNDGKKPYVSNTKRGASSVDPIDWTTYSEAMNHCLKDTSFGLGFVFTNSSLCGVDIDHCIKDGELSPEARKIIEWSNTYTEFSPSGNGVHLIFRGKVPGNIHKHGIFEMYDTGRYFTVTGDLVKDTPSIIQSDPAIIEKVYKYIFRDKIEMNKLSSGTTLNPGVCPHTPQQVITSALKADRSGIFFDLFFNGVSSKYSSPSEADFALCSILAKHCNCDPNMIEQLFGMSKLTRDKWDRPDYRRRTIDNAIANARAKIDQSTGGLSDKVSDPYPEEYVIVDSEQYLEFCIKHKSPTISFNENGRLTNPDTVWLDNAITAGVIRLEKPLNPRIRSLEELVSSVSRCVKNTTSTDPIYTIHLNNGASFVIDAKHLQKVSVWKEKMSQIGMILHWNKMTSDIADFAVWIINGSEIEEEEIGTEDGQVGEILDWIYNLPYVNSKGELKRIKTKMVENNEVYVSAATIQCGLRECLYPHDVRHLLRVMKSLGHVIEIRKHRFRYWVLAKTDLIHDEREYHIAKKMREN